MQNRFVFHTAKINSLAFSTDGQRLLSGSLDSNVMIYSMKTPSRVLSAKVRLSFLLFGESFAETLSFRVLM